MAVSSERPRVLVKEKIAEAGVELLREDFDVELGVDWDQDELERRLGEFDAILIRSATKMTPELIELGTRLRAIGRAGTGVDNVDLDAATKRGIIVANAPESNSVAAAEHTLALAMALFRNVPQADEALRDGRWERSKFGGNELFGKTLGVIGFGRIGQLVARRAQAFDMDVVAYDRFVSPERFRELGVEGVDNTDELYARADLITIHLPKTPDTVNWIDAEALAKMKPGVRIVNCARGELVDLEALADALESGPVAGAALDVFPSEPFTDHPILRHPKVVVTPHLGASTSEAQDRAGIHTAQQIRAALTGGVVTNAVNIAAVRPEVMEALAPFVPLCENLGRLAQGLSDSPAGRVEVEFHGRIAEHDTRLLGISVLAGILGGHTEETVNLVNAPQIAEERGLELVETKRVASEDFTDLVVVRLGEPGAEVEVTGTAVGPRNIPYLTGVWGQSFYMPFAGHLAIFRYHDRPGMIGRVGSACGESAVNIISAAVGAEARPDEAVMAITTDAAVPDDVVARIVADDAFLEGHAVDL